MTGNMMRIGILGLVLTSAGCCNWCNRWCHTNPPAAQPVVYAQQAPVYAAPQCVPVCPPGTVARSGGYQVTGAPMAAAPVGYPGQAPTQCCPY